VMFRLMTAQFARHDTEAAVRAGLGHRFGLLTAALKFTTGLGTIPVLNGSASVAKAFGSTDDGDSTSRQTARFAAVEREFFCRQPEIDELLSRYFRVKIQGIHFCGPAHYNTTLIDGFHSLALVYPVVMWWSRVRAVRNGRSMVTLTDVQAALATVDHNFGYSPALGNYSALHRVSLLAKLKQITALVGWYSR
jgi:lysine-N-methylase